MWNWISSFVYTPATATSTNNSQLSGDSSGAQSPASSHNGGLEAVFFAQHLARASDDFRHLAARYHNGAAKKQQQASATAAATSTTTTSINQKKTCEICACVPATVFALELTSVLFGESTTHNNSGTGSGLGSFSSSPTTPNNTASSAPILCFECFLLAFRALVLPKLAESQKKQGMDHLVKQIEEAALVDSVVVVGDVASDKTAPRSPASPASKTSLGPLTNAAAANNNGKNARALPCPRCMYPCAQTVAWCPACGTQTPWSVACTHCKVSAAAAPPICVVTSRAHLQWSCEACTFTNSCDTPACSMCQTLRSWKCPRCDTSQKSRRDRDGQRNCFQCGYKFIEMSATTVRRMGLDEGSVRQSDAAVHELERSAYKVDKRLLALATSNETSKLTALKLRRVKMDGDGNCGFRAISFALFGTPIGHMLVRRAVVLGLQHRRDDLGAWFESPQHFDDFLTQMGQSGTWADEMALRVCAQVFGVHLHILSSDEHHWHFHFSPFAGITDANEKKELEATRPHIFLSYAAPVHYDGIDVRVDGASSRQLLFQTSLSALLKNLADGFVKEEQEWVVDG